MNREQHNKCPPERIWLWKKVQSGRYKRAGLMGICLRSCASASSLSIKGIREGFFCCCVLLNVTWKSLSLWRKNFHSPRIGGSSQPGPIETSAGTEFERHSSKTGCPVCILSPLSVSCFLRHVLLHTGRNLFRQTPEFGVKIASINQAGVAASVLLILALRTPGATWNTSETTQSILHGSFGLFTTVCKTENDTGTGLGKECEGNERFVKSRLYKFESVSLSLMAVWSIVEKYHHVNINEDERSYIRDFDVYKVALSFSSK